MTYIHFAQLFGLISTILASGILFNLTDARNMAKAMIGTPAGFIFTGVLPLIFGSWVILQSSAETGGWAYVVLLIGWLMLLCGIFRLWFVSLWMRCIQHRLDDAPLLFALFGLIFGLLLLYIGFITS